MKSRIFNPFAVVAATFAFALVLPTANAGAGDLIGYGGVLPAGSDIEYTSLYQPREIFRSEAGTRHRAAGPSVRRREPRSRNGH